MATDTQSTTEMTAEEKVAWLRDLFADAPEMGKARWSACSRDDLAVRAATA